MTPAGKRLLIAGGGTGGHIFPAIAVAEQWEAAGGETLFVGARGGMECRMIPETGRRLITLEIGRIKGGGTLDRIRTLLGLPAALRQARDAVRAYAPHAVLGMGGYASGPAVVAARLLGIPTLLSEQNAIPGLTNRLLGRVASRVLTAFAQAGASFPAGRVLETGNPVRQSFLQSFPPVQPPAPGEPLRLLVFGGSQGARVFTETVPEAVIHLKERGFACEVRQQARPEDLDSLTRRYREAGIVAETGSFFQDMAGAYAWSHLVISRAGAMSVTELAIAARPALLVPYPFAADDHQTANARPLTDAGGAWTRTQKEFNVTWLTEFLTERLHDPQSLRAAGEKARALARPQAACAITDAILQLLTP
ncbi:MAG: undecaprenyldiphospho-muramoylpentapeptide beta-N-acetylglucosaminyltransferase [Magnetococcales bacterium]|nr:undecaprenyldiphospho-muramoylpentapeptide beta-N-acetylglucosaminyltransferase [Magnetococcales bacterium]